MQERQLEALLGRALSQKLPRDRSWARKHSVTQEQLVCVGDTQKAGLAQEGRPQCKPTVHSGCRRSAGLENRPSVKRGCRLTVGLESRILVDSNCRHRHLVHSSKV